LFQEAREVELEAVEPAPMGIAQGRGVPGQCAGGPVPGAVRQRLTDVGRPAVGQLVVQQAEAPRSVSHRVDGDPGVDDETEPGGGSEIPPFGDRQPEAGYLIADLVGPGALGFADGGRNEDREEVPVVGKQLVIAPHDPLEFGLAEVAGVRIEQCDHPQCGTGVGGQVRDYRRAYHGGIGGAERDEDLGHGVSMGDARLVQGGEPRQRRGRYSLNHWRKHQPVQCEPAIAGGQVAVGGVVVQDQRIQDGSVSNEAEACRLGVGVDARTPCSRDPKSQCEGPPRTA